MSVLLRRRMYGSGWQSALQVRFLILFLLIFSVILIAAVGYYPATIGQVSEGSAAEAAGIEGRSYNLFKWISDHFYQEISVYTFFHPGKDLEVTYERDAVLIRYLLRRHMTRRQDAIYWALFQMALMSVAVYLMC